MSKKHTPKSVVCGAEDGVPLSVELSILSAKIRALGHLIEIQQVEDVANGKDEINFGIGSLLTDLGRTLMDASRKLERKEMNLREVRAHLK